MKFFIDTEFLEGFHKPLFGKSRHFIDLISIGIISERGNEYYAISNEFDIKEAYNNIWLRENVLTPIYFELSEKDGEDYSHINKAEAVISKYQYNELKRLIRKYGKSNSRIAKEIQQFIFKSYGVNNAEEWGIDLGPVQFYAYFGDYDWTLFCSLFGTMQDFPRTYPQYCRDLKQMLDEKIETLNMSYRETFISSAPDVGDDILNRPATLEEKLRYVKCRSDYPRQEREHNALGDCQWNVKLNDFIKNLK